MQRSGAGAPERTRAPSPNPSSPPIEAIKARQRRLRSGHTLFSLLDLFAASPHSQTNASPRPTHSRLPHSHAHTVIVFHLSLNPSGVSLQSVHGEQPEESRCKSTSYICALMPCTPIVPSTVEWHGVSHLPWLHSSTRRTSSNARTTQRPMAWS